MLGRVVKQFFKLFHGCVQVILGTRLDEIIELLIGEDEWLLQIVIGKHGVLDAIHFCALIYIKDLEFAWCFHCSTASLLA